jgi:hypothetical protein
LAEGEAKAAMNETGKAERLAGELLKGFSGESPILPGRSDVFVADVAADLERLGQFIKWSWKFHDFPCLVDDEGPLPIDVSTSPPILSFMNISSGTPLYSFMEAFQGLKFEGIFVGLLKDVLHRRVTRFLSVRGSTDEDDEAPYARSVSVGAAHAGFSSGPTGYLSFQVQTMQSGLRIHYSPSYLLDWSKVFGAPSTPVDGWIRPGRYKFGGMRNDGRFLIDDANFDIPPLRAASLIFR